MLVPVFKSIEALEILSFILWMSEDNLLPLLLLLLFVKEALLTNVSLSFVCVRAAYSALLPSVASLRLVVWWDRDRGSKRC